MRSRLEIGCAALLFAVLGLAAGGCGTLSSGVRGDSALLASPSVPEPPMVARAEADPAAAALPPQSGPATGGGITPRAGEQTLTPTVGFAPVSFELVPAERQPSWMVAFAGPLIAQQSSPPPAAAGPPVEAELQEYDPWEPFNEKMFAFNYNFDKYLLKPVAKAYNFIMPDLFQQMLEAGFDNILVVPRLANNLLQLNFKGLATEVGRFLINSTLGIGGLFDIAKKDFNLQKTRVDFGQTLGRWGVGPGPYLILPFFPPFTVRDGIGYGVDRVMDPLTYFIPFIWEGVAINATKTVNDRSLNLDLFQGFEETTVDLYSAVRNGYLQRRDSLIRGGP